MYNGHKNYNHWNVALWLFNDYETYHLVVWAVKHCPTLDHAARLLNDVTDRQTPDGVTYTYTSIRAAITNLHDWK